MFSNNKIISNKMEKFTIKHFKLKLDPTYEKQLNCDVAERVYRPGDRVHCRCDITLDGELDLDKQIEIKFVANANIYWNEERSVGNGNERKTEIQNIIDRQDLGTKLIFLKTDKRTIKDGQFSLPFTLYLDPSEYSKYPCTFKGKYGSIKYQFKAEICENSGELQRINEKRNLEILFEAPVRVDNQALLRRKVSDHRRKTFGYFTCFSRQTIKFGATIERMGHSFGSSVPVKSYIENSSNKTVRPRFTLVKRITYNGHGKPKHDIEILGEVDGNDAKPGMIMHETFALKVPAKLPLFPTMLRIITVEYYVHCELDIPFATDLEFDLPLIINEQKYLI